MYCNVMCCGHLVTQSCFVSQDVLLKPVNQHYHCTAKYDITLQLLCGNVCSYYYNFILGEVSLCHCILYSVSYVTDVGRLSSKQIALQIAVPV